MAAQRSKARTQVPVRGATSLVMMTGSSRASSRRGRGRKRYCRRPRPAPPGNESAGCCASQATVSRVPGAEPCGRGGGQLHPLGGPAPRPAPPAVAWRGAAQRGARRGVRVSPVSLPPALSTTGRGGGGWKRHYPPLRSISLAALWRQKRWTRSLWAVRKKKQ